MEVKIYKTAMTEAKVADIAPEMAEPIKPGVVVRDKKHLYVACGDALLEVLSLQPNGKKRMDAVSFLNGLH